MELCGGFVVFYWFFLGIFCFFFYFDVFLYFFGTGAWDAVAAKVLKHLAYATAARSGATPGELHQSLLEELSVVVRSWRAKAALRRRFEVTTPESA